MTRAMSFVTAKHVRRGERISGAADEEARPDEFGVSLTLEEIRRAQGTLVFETQYQQNPLPLAGNIVKREWFEFFDEAPDEFELVITSWDPASTLEETSDWSVGTVWGAIGLDFYLLEVVRTKLEPALLRHEILQLSKRYKVDATLIEDGELGRAIASELRNSRALRPILDPPRYDKLARMQSQSVRFESRQVHLPREAPWLATYMTELLAFPTAKHDDQVDATSQALR